MNFGFQPNRIFAAFGILTILVFAAYGQGIIFPRPCERPIPRCAPPPQVPQQPLKVKTIKFTTKITDQAAVTHVEQVFENDTPFVLEGIYFFPLPENVSITEFAMWDGDKRLVGEVRSKEEARRIYDNIVRARRDPALLEYAGKNLFQASVFPIQPNSDKKVELTYSQALTGESGTVAYRYPLGTGWKANGFVPMPPRPVPMPGIREQSRSVQPPRNGPGSISAQIEITSNVPIKGVYSPSHEIEVKREGERRAKISFEARSNAAQSDFQLFYNLSEQDFGVSLLTYREPGKDGYFLLLVSPKAKLDENNVVAKDIVFVMDTSGSMSDDNKIEKAKAALRYGVNSLDVRDRFNIVSFAGEDHLLSEQLLAGGEEGKRQAREFIDRMKPAGGTNINDALISAFKLIQKSDRTRMIVLVTDGQPTVGESQPKRILENVRQANKNQIRLFTFGVGYDVNTILLDGLANENRGAVAYIEPNEDLEVKVSSFFAKVNHPVLSNLSINWAGLETDLVYPRTLPDLFHGSQLVLVGRYKGHAKDHRLTLLGDVNGQNRHFVYEDLSFPEKQAKNEFLANLWAMRRVGHLLDQIRANGESKELRDEIVELGTRYGIVTPYTSYLVLEPGMRVAGMPGTVNETVMIPSERKSYDALGHANAPPAPMSRAASGQGAVQLSKEKEELLRADKLTPTRSSQGVMRQASGKTFYLRDEVWTDSEFKAEDKFPIVMLKFGSNEFFGLIGKEPKLADCFALGERVVVVWNGKVYKVEP
ncbi:MAG: VWA domain-containing protein [Acidobacteria bacterium]|nr:VWA domain-containing protein [Acidobacteriota bacterium]